MRIRTGVAPSLRKSSTAAPPRMAKIGMPNAPAATMTNIPGQTSCPSRRPGDRQITAAATRPEAASNRPLQVEPARQITRPVTSANEIGSTSWAIHVGIDGPIVPPNSRSETTSCRPPQTRSPAIAAVMAAVRIFMMRRLAPSGMNVPVASERSFPSRAAMAAPRKPTHKVRC